jgi:MATE family multidrug resistance protein
MLSALSQNRILKIALPAIISNITVPLLGLVDVAIVGHLGSSAYIGAIAVGNMIFNVVYWIFGFLRMGTSGMTSQALGKRDLNEVNRLLARSAGTGFIIAILILLFQYPVLRLALSLIESTPEVEYFASQYFHILIWGAPAVLGLYGFSGWFIGMQNSRFPMYIAITQNLLNIGVSVFLVYGAGLKVAGIAWGTLIAQYGGLILALILWIRYYPSLRKRFILKGIWEHNAMKNFFRVNRDIFLRTLCIVIVTMYFTTAGASRGNTILAVNTLLMQFFTLFSYFMDGFAYAGEALAGKHTGTGNLLALKKTVRDIFLWGAGIAFIFTLLYVTGNNTFLKLLTNDKTIIDAAKDFSYWVWAIPFAAFIAFIWDGIFIGATASRPMLISMAIATMSFFIAYFGLSNILGNHALWFAFIVYLFLRGFVQTLLAPKVIRSSTRA